MLINDNHQDVNIYFSNTIMYDIRKVIISTFSEIYKIKGIYLYLFDVLYKIH